MVTWETSFFHPPACCWLPLSLCSAEDPREVTNAKLHREHTKIKKAKQTTKKYEIRVQPPVMGYWNIYMGSVTRKMSTNKHWVEGQVQAMLAWSTPCASGWCQGCEHGLMAVAKETVLEMGLEFLSEGWLQRWFVLQKHTRLILTKAAIAQQLIQPLVW